MRIQAHHAVLLVFSVLIWAAGLVSASINFQDSFSGSLKPEWRWLDEDKSAWNLNNGRLNIRRYPGNGFYGNVRIPVLYYPSVPFETGVVAQVKVGFDVDQKYGQAGIILYYNNDNYAKFTLEYWWDYGIYVIFLREQNGVPCHDKDICEKDILVNKIQIELRIRYENGKFITEFRDIGASSWTPHFTVDAIANKGPINIGLYSQADMGSNDWAWFDDFSLKTSGNTPVSHDARRPSLRSNETAGLSSSIMAGSPCFSSRGKTFDLHGRRLVPGERIHASSDALRR